MVVLDVCIIGIFGFLLFRWMRHTEAAKIFFGLLVIACIYFIADVSGLSKTAFLIKGLLETMIVGLVVIFHPELRMALRKIGGMTVNPKPPSYEKWGGIREIEEAVFHMSKHNIGGLIVLDAGGKVAYEAENKTDIGAVVSRALLETVFDPHTPLHDGAVLIREGIITHAGCKLPISGKQKENLGTLGTRHLAALECAETFGVVSIVVSEESGNVSVVTEKGRVILPTKEDFRAFFEGAGKREKMFHKFLKK